MDQSALVGLLCGSFLGAVYVIWQAFDLRRQKRADPEGRRVVGLVPSAALRLVIVAGGWWVAFRYAGADRWWLTGSLLVAYSAPLIWQVRKLFPPRSP